MFRHNRRRRHGFLTALPNMLAMLDLYLFLLLVTITGATGATRYELQGTIPVVPDASKARATTPRGQVRITVRANGTYEVWNRPRASGLDEVRSEIARVSDGTLVVMTVDRGAPFDAYAQVVSVAAERGLKHVFLVEPDPAHKKEVRQ